MYNLTLNQYLVLAAMVKLKANARRDYLLRGYGSLTLGLNIPQPMLLESDIDTAIEVLISLKLIKRNKAGSISAVYDYDKTMAIIKAATVAA